MRQLIIYGTYLAILIGGMLAQDLGYRFTGAFMIGMFIGFMLYEMIAFIVRLIRG